MSCTLYTRKYEDGYLENLSLEDASQELVVDNEELVVPAARAFARRAQDLSTMIHCKILSTGGVVFLETYVLMFKPRKALLLDNLSCICGTKRPAEPGLIKLCG
jgi:hypothetical protein